MKIISWVDKHGWNKTDALWVKWNHRNRALWKQKWLLSEWNASLLWDRPASPVPLVCVSKSGFCSALQPEVFTAATLDTVHLSLYDPMFLDRSKEHWWLTEEIYKHCSAWKVSSDYMGKEPFSHLYLCTSNPTKVQVKLVLENHLNFIRFLIICMTLIKN